MPIFDRTARRMAGKPVLLLPADPGPALLAAAQLYDPQLRRHHDRLGFNNGILLYGPVQITPELAGQVGLPGGEAVAWYAAGALQQHRTARSEADKRADGERLVRGLAGRLGGSTHPARLQPDLAMIVSVYSERDAVPGQLIEVLRPWAGDLAVADEVKGTYSLTGRHSSFYVAYWPPAMSRALPAPPAAGALFGKPVHHWDLHSGQPADKVSGDLCQAMGEAAMALAAACGGTAVDVFGFPVTTPGDLRPA